MSKRTKNQTLQLAPTDSISISGNVNPDGSVSVSWVITATEPLFVVSFYRKINSEEETILASALCNYTTGFYPPSEGSCTDTGYPEFTGYPAGTTISYRVSATVGDVTANASFFSPTLTLTV